MKSLLKLPNPPAALALLLAFSNGTARSESIYGLVLGDRLVSFDSASPGTLTGSSAVTGLSAGDSLVGIDFRPATGQLYGLGRSSSLYTIDTASGAASLIGAGSFSPALTGSAYGFDFNPTVDRIRLVGDNGQNLRLHPVTGAVAANDGMLRYVSGDPNFAQPPQVVGAAYTQNFAGATSTTLYGIDSVLDVLVRQAPPNDGVLTTIGGLGVNATDLTGFDISGVTGTAFASFVTPGSASAGLYTVNLGTGAASWIGGIEAGGAVLDIAVVPEPGVIALLGLGGLGVLALRRGRAVC